MHAVLTALARPRISSTLVAGFIAACAWTQLVRGVDSTPAPLREILVQLLGYSQEVGAKLIIAGEMGVAVAIIAGGTRLLAVSGAVASAFLSLACLSAAMRQGGMILPIVTLATSLVLVRISLMDSTRPVQRARRGLSPAWTALAALAAGTTAAHWSSAIWVPTAATPAVSKTGAQAIDFDMKPYVGRLLSESPVGTYMPELVARIGAESALIVFYNPYCEACHTLFADNFSTPRAELSIAVEIPIAAGATLATDQPPEPIVCAMCEKTTLPPGPAWMIAAPLTVRVEKGVIRCVSDRFGGDCFTRE